MWASLPMQVTITCTSLLSPINVIRWICSTTFVIDLKCWMAQNFLQLNIDNTELIIIGARTVNAYTSKHLGSLSQNIAQNCKNLGVIFDNHLSLNNYVKTVVQSCFFLQLGWLSKVSSILSTKNLEIVIYAFIYSCLGYCNLLHWQF